MTVFSKHPKGVDAMSKFSEFLQPQMRSVQGSTLQADNELPDALLMMSVLQQKSRIQIILMLKQHFKHLTHPAT